MAEVLPIRSRATRANPKAPPAPPGLTSASRKIWKEVNAEWQIDSAALPLLRAALECLDRYRAAADQIRRDGPTVRDANGVLRTHPAHAVLRDNLREARQVFRQLNLEVAE